VLMLRTCTVIRLCDATWLDVEEGSTNGHNPFGWGHLINHSDTPNVMYEDLPLTIHRSAVSLLLCIHRYARHHHHHKG
jgi:hypothetical protein